MVTPFQTQVVGPEFIAADAHNAVLVDAHGISFDQGPHHAEFAWHEVGGVHHAVIGLCLVVTVVHRTGMRYECRVGVRRTSRLREWCARLEPVLGHYTGGGMPAAVHPAQAAALPYPQVSAWVGAAYGTARPERRITDIGYAYVVNTQPEAYLDGDASAMTYGGGPLIVVKRDGAVWGFGSDPIFMPLYEARTEEEFRRAMARIMPQWDPDRPSSRIPFH
ncbi:hypothetical protein J7E88_06970 [Streptomyces sp. ISL-10]|uniref:hypothetical protein n=1 Tax=Streptomyces sp. ISL-10 TaxID=2819172 RepID=UPI001BEA8DF0|nr:hypothetical protein [Streptomyces sp. ISL-10]MBT2365065.1 hypothetical protein [Streptomyces sp. ISL-10]